MTTPTHEIVEAMERVRSWLDDENYDHAGAPVNCIDALLRQVAPVELGWQMPNISDPVVASQPDADGSVTVLQKLEAWNNKHKGHTVKVEGPTGYAADCWTVTLNRDGKKIVCSETTFYVPEEGVNQYWHEHDGNLYCCVVDGDSMDDWPGLEATILKALECAAKFWPPESYKAALQIPSEVRS
jgi:hypothetical protein